MEALEEYERRRDTLGLVDLAEVMESGVTEPEMLTDRLVQSEHHSVYGMKETSKTWLLAMDVRELLRRARRWSGSTRRWAARTRPTAS